MSFIAKCYNGHKILIEDELDGETIECPICEEEFVAVREYEELGKVNEWKVPYHTRGYIHLGMGLIIGLFFSFLIKIFSSNSTHLFWQTVYYISIGFGIAYIFRGLMEVFRSKDPFVGLVNKVYGYYYIILKKIRFFRK